MAGNNLATHEAVCEQRYNEINRRLDNLEDKVDGLYHQIDDFKTFIIKIAIRSGLGIVTALCLAVFAVKM